MIITIKYEKKECPYCGNKDFQITEGKPNHPLYKCKKCYGDFYILNKLDKKIE